MQNGGIDIMQNEVRIEEENVEQVNEIGAPEYISKVKELKQNTVSKEEYNRVIEENKALAEAVANGSFSNDEEPEVSLDDLEKQCTEVSSTNLEYVTKRLNYRNAFLEKTGVDLFGPDGDEVAEGLTYAVEEADGDPDMFNSVMKRIIKDPVVPKTKNKR